MQARDERRREPTPNARLAVLTAGVPPHASTPLFDVPTIAGMDTVVIEAGAPFDEVLAAVEMLRSHPPRGLRQRHRPTGPRFVGGRPPTSDPRGSAPTQNRCCPKTATRSSTPGMRPCTISGAQRNSACRPSAAVWAGTAHLRGRSDPRTRRRHRCARGARRTGGSHAGHRSLEPYVPIHPVRPR